MKKHPTLRNFNEKMSVVSFGKTKVNEWHGVRNFLRNFKKVKNNNDGIKVVQEYAQEFDLGGNDPVVISKKIQTNFGQFAKWCKGKLA
jgi:hypothetical protein